MKTKWIMVSIGERYTHVWKYDYQSKFRCYVMSNDAYDLRKMPLEEVKLRLAVRGVDKIWKTKDEHAFLTPYNIDAFDFERNMEVETYNLWCK